MERSKKSPQLELLERRKRIPPKTQEILHKMISRRYAELCGAQQAANCQAQPVSAQGLPELCSEREPEPATVLALGKSAN